MKQYLAIASKLITDNSWKTEWEIPAQLFGVEKYIKKGRLLRSQTFEDDDYPACVLGMFNNILIEEGKDKTKAFVDYVLKEELETASDSFIQKNNYFISMLSINNSNLKIQGVQFKFDKYLSLEELPDEFYRDLQGEINKAYNFGLFSVIPFLIRKFIENLIIDIFRKKYTMRNIDMFYDVNNHKCHNFSKVVENLSNHIDDFKHVEKNLDADFIKLINEYRESGNATAHSISIKFIKEDVDNLSNKADEVSYIIKLLVRVLNLV